MRITFEPSGISIDKYANLYMRADYIPDPGDRTYNEYPYGVDGKGLPSDMAQYRAWHHGLSGNQHVCVPVIPGGVSVEQLDDEEWLDKLPHVWRVNPMLSVFIAIPEGIRADDLILIPEWLNKRQLATMDWALAQPNSAHLVSSFMRTLRPVFQKEPIKTKDRADLIASMRELCLGKSFLVASGGSIMEVQKQSIDVGGDPITRANGLGSYTVVNKTNPANGDGLLDTWQLYFEADATGVECATFFVVAANDLSTRDTEAIGNVPSGSTQTFAGRSTDVLTGDYAGEYHATGSLAWDKSGYDGIWGVSGVDHIPCVGVTFIFYAGDVVSVYATGPDAGGDGAPGPSMGSKLIANRLI